jgi:hypothetical protein
MKIMLLSVVGLMLIPVVVYITGLSLPKAHRATRSALYSAPPERLFSLIVGQQDWRPDIARIESESDPSGRHFVTETTKDGESITYAIEEVTPPTSLKRRISTKNLPYAGTWTYALRRDGQLTHLRITEDGEVYNPIFRFVSYFILRHTRSIDRYLLALGRATAQEIQVQD